MKRPSTKPWETQRRSPIERRGVRWSVLIEFEDFGWFPCWWTISRECNRILSGTTPFVCNSRRIPIENPLKSKRFSCSDSLRSSKKQPNSDVMQWSGAPNESSWMSITFSATMMNEKQTKFTEMLDGGGWNAQFVVLKNQRQFCSEEMRSFSDRFFEKHDALTSTSESLQIRHFLVYWLQPTRGNLHFRFNSWAAMRGMKSKEMISFVGNESLYESISIS